MSRWVDESISLWCSCWPCISTRYWVNSRSSFLETCRSWIHASVLPFCLRIRRSKIPSLICHSMPFSLSQSPTWALLEAEKSPDTEHSVAPSRIIELSTRAPSKNPRASTINDLPVPVSPENTVIPADKSISMLSIMAKLRTESCSSIVVSRPTQFCP